MIFDTPTRVQRRIQVSIGILSVLPSKQNATFLNCCTSYQFLQRMSVYGTMDVSTQNEAHDLRLALNSTAEWYGDVRAHVWRVAAPVLIVLGVLGNCVTAVTILKKKRKESSQSTQVTWYYVFALAVTDTAVLLCGPLRGWIKATWGIDVRRLSDASCRTQIFMTYASIHLSSWILVALILAVVAKEICTCILPTQCKLHSILGFVRRPRLVITLTVFVVTFVDVIVPIITSLHGHDGVLCSPRTANLAHFRDFVFEWIDFVLAFGMPLVILLFGTIFTSMLHYNKVISNPSSQTSLVTDIVQCSWVIVPGLTALFAFTMTPGSIFQLYFPYWSRDLHARDVTDVHAAQDVWRRFQQMILVHEVLDVISYVNNACKFFVYLAVDRSFRQTVFAYTNGCRRQNTDRNISMDSSKHDSHNVVQVWSVTGRNE